MEILRDKNHKVQLPHHHSNYNKKVLTNDFKTDGIKAHAS